MGEQLECDTCGASIDIKELTKSEAGKYASGGFLCTDCKRIASDENLLRSDSFIPAGLIRRGLAFLIDVLPITALVFLVFYASTPFKEVFHNFMNDIHNVDYRIEYTKYKSTIRFVAGVIYICYAVIFESSRFRGTLGKRILGIEIVDASGDRLTRVTAIKRNVFKILSAIIAMVGYLMAFFNKQRRTLHYTLSGAYVIKRARSTRSV